MRAKWEQTRTPGSETYAKKVQFRVRNDHWIKAPKMNFNRVNPRHYKLQLEEELLTTMAIFLFFIFFAAATICEYFPLSRG